MEREKGKGEKGKKGKGKKEKMGKWEQGKMGTRENGEKGKKVKKGDNVKEGKNVKGKTEKGKREKGNLGKRFVLFLGFNMGSERSEPLRVFKCKRAKRALACARRQSLRRS